MEPDLQSNGSQKILINPERSSLPRVPCAHGAIFVRAELDRLKPPTLRPGPPKVPMLLVNGSSGITVGIATRIPTPRSACCLRLYPPPLHLPSTLKPISLNNAQVPMLLVNGSSGIAVGIATRIPPHNLVEVGFGV
jgi:hypothetical protein